MKKKDIVETFSKNERLIWDMVVCFKGVILRGQLLILLKLVHEIDPRAASNAISSLMKLKLIQSKPAMPACNARMICLTRKGKALSEDKDIKEVMDVTDTVINNLRSIYKVELFIYRLSKCKTKDEVMRVYAHAAKETLFKTKNEFMEIYDDYIKEFGQHFNKPDLKNDANLKNPLDTFNLYQMMSREFFPSYIRINKDTVEVTILYFNLRSATNSLKIKNYYHSLMYIYFMYKRYFYRREYNDLRLNLTIGVFLFDKTEKEYFKKKISVSKLNELLKDNKLANPLDKIQIEVYSCGLDKKYHLKRAL